MIGAFHKSALSATTTLLRSWLIIPGAILLFLLFRLISGFFVGAGIGGQMLAGTIGIACLGLYYQWVSSATSSRTQLKLKEMLEYDYQRFFDLISVGFIIFLFRFPFDLLAQNLAPLMILVINAIVVTFANPVAEILILRRSLSLEALLDSVRFMQQYWIEWLLPQAVLLAAWMLISAPRALVIYAGSDPLAPAYNAFNYIAGYGRLAVFQGQNIPGLEVLWVICAVWFSLFRVNLFLALADKRRVIR